MKQIEMKQKRKRKPNLKNGKINVNEQRETREYYSLSLEDIDLMKLISKILLGPRATISLDILKRYMEKVTGLDLDIIKIERSESPLR